MARNQELYPTDFPEVTPSPQAVLRSHLPDVGDLGVQETDLGMGGPEALGAYTQEDVGAPVSDEQAQRWMEETQIESARIELEMLRDKMLNSRRDLVDELYGGDDPSLRNTKPIADELRKMELKTLMGSIGDPEEMTPEQKLRVAIAKVNISKGVTATVEAEKQKDTQMLNDAVSKYNAGITAQMGSIQQGAQALQTLHAEEDIATIEAEAEVAAAKPEKVSDYRWAYDIWKKDNPKGTPTQFRREWEKPSRATGGLTEASIVKSIDDLALTSEADPARAYSNYLKYRKSLGREEAFNKVRQEMIETAELPEDLTEELIKFYETKHGMNREEVIRRFKAKQSQ